LLYKDEAGEVSVYKGDAQQSDQMKVLVLEDGKLAFYGTPNEFNQSSLPAVTQLTRLIAVMHLTDSIIAAPCGQTENRFR
jgi:hypothetical protein